MSERSTTPTIIDVALHAGVSKSAVSRVLSGRPGTEPRRTRRVREAATDLAYVANAMAQGLIGYRTGTLGVIVRDVTRPIYSHLQSALQVHASARGMRVVTTSASDTFDIDQERRATRTLVSLRVEALIVCSGVLPVDEVVPLRRPNSHCDRGAAGKPDVHGRRGHARRDPGVIRSRIPERRRRQPHTVVDAPDGTSILQQATRNPRRHSPRRSAHCSLNMPLAPARSGCGTGHAASPDRHPKNRVFRTRSSRRHLEVIASRLCPSVVGQIRTPSGNVSGICHVSVRSNNVTLNQSASKSRRPTSRNPRRL
ncbi:LacI family DNA-binding transcriptional regulator [Rhodococcus globerulus]|uniref:LacI family DNA-binding transcriptional regulator n=1 Tax=Rhodococcus globerulus TaxID=33008 RepID=UPI00374F374D